MYDELLGMGMSEPMPHAGMCGAALAAALRIARVSNNNIIE